MTRPFRRQPGWPLMFVAVAGICLSFALGGSPERPPSPVDAAQDAEGDAAAGSDGFADAIGEPRSRPETAATEAVLRRVDARASEALLDPAQGLVLDPDEIAWFDWEFDLLQRPRSIDRGSRRDEPTHGRGRDAASGGGSVRSVSGR